MKDEIKEIIDRLERIDHKEYIAFEFADNATFDEMARCFEERKKMADYITNLQNGFKSTIEELCETTEKLEELEQKYYITRKSYQKVVLENSFLEELKQEIDRLTAESTEWESKFYDLQEEITHLDSVNCHLRKKINNDIYKSRCEKAIEELDKYINSCEIEAEHTLNNEKCLISINQNRKIKTKTRRKH